ncbi:MAG: GGDEF domain-containing protein [Rhodoferax sp.]|jgi:GGDEF domain-containing protein
METPELVVWSAMLGGLGTLAAFALADAVIRRSVASWRVTLFIAWVGAACILLTGIAPTLLPGVTPQSINVLQNSMGLLSGALALRYLGLWMGVAREDRVVRASIGCGVLGLGLAGCTMAVLTWIGTPEDAPDLLATTAVINSVAILLPVVALLRAIRLGDQLARSMLANMGLLTVVVTGLYAHGLKQELGIGFWALTALCTIAFLMVGTYLGLRRDRLNRRLERLARLAEGGDPSTGLAKGSVLISKVDDAFWRSARRHEECTVICLYLRNLYELAETAGHSAEQQILSAMSARMRRSVGFRNVLGLYHPRCFIVVVSTDGKSRLVEKLLQRLHYLMAKPLRVTGSDNEAVAFVPRFGIGAVSVIANDANAAAVVDQAEQLALAANAEAGGQTNWVVHQP